MNNDCIIKAGYYKREKFKSPKKNTLHPLWCYTGLCGTNDYTDELKCIIHWSYSVMMMVYLYSI